MAENSKDLLQLETNTSSSTSCLESRLFVCKKDSSFPLSEAPAQKPTMFPVPQSQVLGKLKDFLGVMAESNKKLMDDAKNNPDNYDIEVLSGNESGYIEMDLMLGVADLHTPEAVAAAESVMEGNQMTIPLAERDSGSESDDSSESEEEKMGSKSTDSKPMDMETESSPPKSSKKKKTNKRKKIVVLP